MPFSYLPPELYTDIVILWAACHARPADIVGAMALCKSFHSALKGLLHQRVSLGTCSQLELYSTLARKRADEGDPLRVGSLAVATPGCTWPFRSCCRGANTVLFERILTSITALDVVRVTSLYASTALRYADARLLHVTTGGIRDVPQLLGLPNDRITHLVLDPFPGYPAAVTAIALNLARLTELTLIVPHIVDPVLSRCLNGHLRTFLDTCAGCLCLLSLKIKVIFPFDTDEVTMQREAAQRAMKSLCPGVMGSPLTKTVVVTLEPVRRFGDTWIAGTSWSARRFTQKKGNPMQYTTLPQSSGGSAEEEWDQDGTKGAESVNFPPAGAAPRPLAPSIFVL
ncbi:hypothetical protein AURDEDRAFT_131662 [Auricularia subglabra TFB-10046 SS5]|uniref:Uncharacterized protein n=1 Tax=Auricularia subglabra (strain TFB-10046 / SS5) TaxID=717982 RepID=J0CT66_AURST|nr:hypothetical protein AURDEDRAFT_131662 [Auricularia subglabra TFB-10046 SS5]